MQTDTTDNQDDAPRLYGLEQRSYSLELRAEEDDDGPRLRGYAAMFNSVSDPIAGLFREQIAPGAFKKTLRGKPDVRALFNHDTGHVLGRTTAGTLKLSEDERGLAVDITPPETSWARDLVVSVQRGDINQMSFGFIPVKDSWSATESGEQLRTLHEVRLLEVSVVAFPAYPATSIQARSLALAMGCELDDLEALLARAEGQCWQEGDEQRLRALIAEVERKLPPAPIVEPVADEAWRIAAAARRRWLTLTR